MSAHTGVAGRKVEESKCRKASLAGGRWLRVFAATNEPLYSNIRLKNQGGHWPLFFEAREYALGTKFA